MTAERPEAQVAPDEIDRAAELLASGGVVGIPTDTVYGLAVDPRRDTAAAVIFAMKERPESVALPVLIGDPGDADSLAFVDERAHVLVDRYWPGPLTVVLRRRPGVVLHLGGDPESVGLRCPLNSVARRLMSITGPLAVTSANLHGGTPARSAGELRSLFGGKLDLVLDGGRCDGEPSTVVSLLASGHETAGGHKTSGGHDTAGRNETAGGLLCLRQGAIPMTAIEELLTPFNRQADPPRGSR